MPEHTLREQVRAAGRALGFVRVGFTTAAPLTEAGAALGRWLAQGQHADMSHLAEQPRHEPRAVFPQARTVIVAALPYRAADLGAPPHGTSAHSASACSTSARGTSARGTSARDNPPCLDPLAGVIAAYARGDDYHTTLWRRLKALEKACRALAGRPIASRICVDSSPLLERALAERAGIGFIGKSTMLIVPGVGSAVLLGELLVDLELPPDAPTRAHCGACARCLDACPSRALVAPYILDARRCISYLTIERRGAVDVALRSSVGTHCFGCDDCQSVCPFNHARRARGACASASDAALGSAPHAALTATANAGSNAAPDAAPELLPRATLQAPSLAELLHHGNAAHRRFVKDSPLRRVNREQLARNAAVCLGNCRSERAIAPLLGALGEHPSALVREHAAWALAHHRGTATRRALARAAVDDPDLAVRQTAARALTDQGALACSCLSSIIVS